jgi:hypothetical protein
MVKVVNRACDQFPNNAGARFYHLFSQGPITKKPVSLEVKHPCCLNKEEIIIDTNKKRFEA